MGVGLGRHVFTLNKSHLFIFIPSSQLVDDIISELALGKAAGTYIGNAFMRGVSGGGELQGCPGLAPVPN